jgi:hypothetical protein
MIMRSILAGLLLCGANAAGSAQEQQASVTADDKLLVGHYYLSGVMETGSELLLKSDGTYQWMLVAGSMDLFSEGSWRTETAPNEKQQVVLTAKVADTNTPLVTVGAVEPWNEVAEENAQEDAMTDRNNAVPLRCKFLADLGEPFVDWSLSPPYQDVSPKLIEQARIAAKEAEKARIEYETAAADAMKGDAKNAALHNSARTARLAWRLAYNKHAQANSDAKLPFERRVEPLLPKQCEMEEIPVRPNEIDKLKWIGGIAVRLQNTEYGSYYNNVEVGFGLESGKTIKRMTRSGGIAWIPRSNDDRVTSIIIAGKSEINPKIYKLPISAIAQGYIPIEINLATEQPFSKMQLVVSGRDLIGFDGRGRYSRN